MIQQNIVLSPIGGNEPMQLIKKEGVTLAYQDINPGSPPMLFVHGWGCDHTSFAQQAEFFRRSHRVVSVDLRGHGKSDAPHQDYTMATLADDLGWVCAELALTKPIVVGHSMGGNVVLELAARYPEIPASVVLIDSVILPHQSILDALQPMVEALRGPDYRAAYQQVLLAICLPMMMKHGDTTHRFFAEGSTTCCRVHVQESSDGLRCNPGRGWLPCTHRVHRRSDRTGRSDSVPEPYPAPSHRPDLGIRPFFSAVRT
jgi:pimeloyl-ACP methyl ester carboxylesterase